MTLFFRGFGLALTLAFLLVASTAFAQQLERKGTLGIQMTSENGSISVLEVIPNTTAANIGLQAGDAILRVNGTAFSEIGPFIHAIGTWRQNDALTLNIQRSNEELTLSGTVQGKPLETSEHGQVIYGQVHYDNGMLRSILELPDGVDKPPVVFFLPGIGCGSLDYHYNPTAGVKQLVESLVAQGIAVYRVEKPGMGDSEGCTPCLEMDFNYEVEAFRTALATLKKVPGIDAEQVYLYGHSLGTVSAPLVAAGNDVAGIVAWGGISRTWFEYELQLSRDQKVLLEEDYVKTEQDFRAKQPFFYDLLVNKHSPKQLAENPAYTELLASQFDGDLWHGMHHYSYFHALNDVDLRTAYKTADCPLLALAGEFDIATINTHWAGELAEVVNYYRPGDGEAVIIPKTTHHYHTVPTLKQYNRMRWNGQLTAAYEAQHFNADVPLIVGRWVKERAQPANAKRD